MSETSSVRWEELVQSLLVPMVAHPDVLAIEVSEPPAGGFAIRSAVHPDDTGRVIGRNGTTVSALRTLIEFAAMRAGTSATFDVADA